jgi:DNA-binding MarR family transcriptional regulator
MMGEIEQTELWPTDTQAETLFFHVLRAMIQRDKIAEMGTTTFCVYVVLKSYASLEAGYLNPSRETIARHIGASEPTVDRAIKRLVEMGLVRKQPNTSKDARGNEYELIEAIPMISKATREVVGHGESKYIPLQFEALRKQLEAFAASGKMGKGLEVKIILNNNFITQAPDSTVNNHYYNAGIQVIPKDDSTSDE